MSQRFVQPAVVVIVLPFLRFLPDLIERPKDVSVEEFASKAAIQALDIRDLGWLPWLDKSQSGFSVFAPRVGTLADELRAIVDADHRRKASAFFQLLENADDAAGR
jgi:hypothetical protein